MSHIKGTVTINEIGLDLVVEWTLDYFSLLEGSTTCYKSPEFSFDDESWQFWIYPIRQIGHDSFEHVSLYLVKCHSGRSIIRSFSLSFKTAEGGKFNERHGIIGSDGHYESFKFKRFILRSELTRRKSYLMPDGVLTVVCIIWRSTSAGGEKGEESNAGVNKSDVAEASGSSQAGSTTIKEPEGDASNAEVNKSDVAEASGSSQTGTTTTEESEGDASKVEKNKSDVAEASGSSQAGTTTTKEAVLKWIEENCGVASKGKKRKRETNNDEACASGSSFSPHQKMLQDDLKYLFLKKEDCDIIIIVKDSEIPAHRLILKSRSPVFASTFQHNMKEEATGVVEIEDCDPSPFMDFLCYIYCGDVGMISQETVFDLFTLADKYEVLGLKAACLEFVKQNITVDTFCETITLALQHTETEHIATDFFVRNAEEILQTVKWQTFTAENPTQSNELMIKLVKWFKHSNVCISCQSQNLP